MVRLLYLITAGLTHYPTGSPFTPGELYEGRAGGGRCCSVLYLLAIAQAIEPFDNDRLLIESKLGM